MSQSLKQPIQRTPALWGRLGVLLLGLSLLHCTETNPRYGEGTEGGACFPDGTCGSGLLVCKANQCIRRDPVIDGTIPLPDGRVSTLDGPLLVDSRPPIIDQSCASEAPAPALESYTKSTTATVVALQGKAPQAKQVIVFGGAKTQIETVLNGSFCVEVQLKVATTNLIQVVAVDGQGCYSKPALASVKQMDQKATNWLLGRTPAVNTTPQNGKLSQLTDGLTNAWVRFSFIDPSPECDIFAYLWFDLGDIRTIDQVTVKYPVGSGFKHYLNCWALWVSSQKNPSSPEPYSYDWTTLKEETSGPTTTLTISIPQTKARHLALLMFQDGEVNPSEMFDLTEVEAWDQSGSSVPPEQCP